MQSRNQQASPPARPARSLARMIVKPALGAVGVAVTVSCIVLGVGVLLHPASRGPSDPPPPVLHLSGSASGVGGTDPVRDLVPGAAGGYLPIGPLPAGPASAPVYRFGAGAGAPDAAVRRLARALGLTGQPQRVGESWLLDAAEGRLTVAGTAGAPWSFTLGPRCVPGPLPPTAKLPTGCLIAGPGGVVGGLPSPARVRAAARQVWAALGLTTALTRVSGATAVADPVVGGLVTTGWSTRITVDPTGRIVVAFGHLAAPTVAGRYPVIGAREALSRLPAGRGVVTSARFGLALVTDARGPLLVPAWLFTLVGRSGLLPVVAVADQYLSPAPSSTPVSGGLPPCATPAPSGFAHCGAVTAPGGPAR